MEAADGLPEAAYRRRFVLKPGLTGLNQVLQVSDPSLMDPARRIEVDKFYVANRSVGLDLRILARSFAVVLASEGDTPIRLRDHVGVNASIGTSLDTVGEKLS